MKRGWIGFALLLALLVGGVFSSWWLSVQQEPLERLMEQAGEAALQSDWIGADRFYREAWQQWENRWHMTAAFTDHGPMEIADGLFAQLETYRKAEEKLAYAAVCAELAKQLGALGEAHVPNWWNLL